MSDLSVDFRPKAPHGVAMEARIAVLEHIAKTTAAALERLEQRQDQMLDRFDRRFDAIDRRFGEADRRIDTLNAHHRADFIWLIAIQIATAGGLLTAMARGFHWL